MKHLRLLAGVLALAALLGPREGESCGAEKSYLTFSTTRYAGAGEFKGGRLGVLRPPYDDRPDMLLAYRVLAGVPLSGPETPRPLWEGSPDPSRVTPWEKARAEVSGLPAAASIDPDKKVPNQDYEAYPNCLAGAFETAAATLRQRVAKWGASSPNVAEWVRGQDQVFQDCSATEPAIPDGIDSGDPLLIADRAYQIAAAEFYAGQYDDAIADFEDIAADASSPWAGIAPYLAARTLIRASTMTGSESLPEAAKRLQAIIDDPARQQYRESAQGLLEFVRTRIEPQRRLTELGRQLLQPNLEPELGRILTDYTFIWKRLDAAQSKLPTADSEVADWIETFQSGELAIEKWRSKRTLPWLVSAIAWLKMSKAEEPDLVAAARAIRPDSPAYATVTYHGILKYIDTGRFADARRWIDAALATKQSDSVVNLFRAERLRIASDWTEFLRYAPRKPADYIDPKHPVAFSYDAALPLNQSVPLQQWIDAANSASIPKVLQTDIARAGWVRAIILDDTAAARTLAERLVQLDPQVAPEMRGYLAERDPATAKFSAVYLMLRAAGLEPVLRPGDARRTPITKQDDFRDNWWTLSKPVDPQDPELEQLGDLYPKGRIGPTGFLSKDQRAAGEEEWQRLLKLADNSVNYLCPQAIAWARSHPQDPRVPQALHLAVNATHYGPADESSHQYSKEAFDLLHHKYPNSEWTKRTKYWY
jgi:hypothetical protein